MSSPHDRSESVDSITPREDSIAELRSRMVSGERQISISSNRPATTILAADHVMNPTHDDQGGKASRFCGIYLTGNAKTLLISTFLFLAITSGQYFAAIAANSKSLKADCVSMLVDAISYIGNLLGECTPNPRRKKQMELLMSLGSLSVLLYFTTTFLIEAIDVVNEVDVTCLCQDNSTLPDYGDCNWSDDSDNTDEACNIETVGTLQEEEEVNAYIVFGFALGGLLFDVISLWAYKYYASSPDPTSSHPHHHHMEDHPLTHRHSDHDHSNQRPNVNMLSALMHVFSDLLRSTTTLVESFIIFANPTFNSAVIDGWATMVVCSLIAFGGIWSLGIWLGEVWSYCSGDDEEKGRKEKGQFDEINDLTKKLVDSV